ncbi:MAG: uracil-DNA glycosylase [Phycisphaerae bacterium]|nr:uracil-DNA glycosylase [Gemmatimonadaceae bacterium]
MIGAPLRNSAAVGPGTVAATTVLTPDVGTFAPPVPPVTREPTDNVAGSTNSTEAVSGESPAEPVSIPSVEPERRFTEAASTDWRAALKDLSPGAKSPSVSVDPYPKWLLDLGIPTGLTASPPSNAPTSAVTSTLQSLEEIASTVASCRACPLGALALNPVPGEGNPNADFLCVGEAPGQTEDETGRPFVGAAGQLLTKILGAIKLSREDVFICNVLKHRPPGNRDPAPDEVRACTPYLNRQITLVQPRVILALGTFAAQTLLNTKTPLGKLRGQVHRYQGVPLIVTYHPAALLRNESWKRPTWDDVQLARRIFDAARSASGTA